MSLDWTVARGVRKSPGPDVAQPLDLHYRRLRVRKPLPVAEFRLPILAPQDLEDFSPHFLLDLRFPDHEEDGEGQRGARRLRAGEEQVGRRVDDLLVPLGLVKTGLLILGSLREMEPIVLYAQY